MQQFQAISGSTYPSELKSTTLIRCCPHKLKEHLRLSITETSTYQEIREKIMNYEKVSRSWNQETILKQLHGDASGQDTGGPAPMEVDHVKGDSKGKGKKGDKGKVKGKDGWWNTSWAFGRGRGNGKGGGKGKG